MDLPDGLLFVPRWLGGIDARGASSLTARLVSPRSLVPGGAGFPDLWRLRRSVSVSGTSVGREELLAHEARVVGARRARKEARAEEMAGRDRDYDIRDMRAQRRADREARRIMLERRAACRAAFGGEDG